MNIFKIFSKKYREIDFNLIHIFKSLCYFEEADKQPMLKMFENVLWTDVKKFFIKEVKNLKKDIFI